MMMTNLFSIFDPSLSLFSSSWLVLVFSLIVFPGLYFSSSCVSSFFSFIFNLFYVEVSYVLNNPVKGCCLFFGCVFVFLSTLNLFSIFPHVFAATSHLLLTFPLSFSIWLGIIVFVWVSSFKSFLVHLVPVSTPLALISFMVLVEVLSSLIRPLALTFRLTANLMAGHLILSLLGSGLLGLNTFSFFFGSPFLFILTFMELGVCLVQAYVFSSLILLYSSESAS